MSVSPQSVIYATIFSWNYDASMLVMSVAEFLKYFSWDQIQRRWWKLAYYDKLYRYCTLNMFSK